MAKNKIQKNTDIAAGFFSDKSNNSPEKITPPPIDNEVNEKHNIGRPPKEGLKNEQYTLTMHPELYEKLKIVAQQYTRGNFSSLIDEAVKMYCKKNHISLSSISIDDSIMDMYRAKQAKRKQK